MSDHPTMTQDELHTEMVRRFGPDHQAWAFICPSCKNVATIGDFIDAGADPNKAGRECIGRSLGALSKDIPKGKYEGRGCDWAAYGLFQGPVEYTTPEGESIWGFEIAPATPTEETK